MTRNNNKRNNNKRRGTTMIEMAGLLGLLIIIAAATVQSLSSLAFVSTDNQSSRSNRAEIDRFAVTLRKDAAKSDEVSSKNNEIVFSLDQQQVRYRWDPKQFTMFRQIQDGDNVQASERFRFSEETQVSSRVVQERDDSRRLSIQLRRSGSQPNRPKFLIEVGL